MTISQLEEAGIRKVATKVTTTLNCLEGAVQRFCWPVGFEHYCICITYPHLNGLKILLAGD